MRESEEQFFHRVLNHLAVISGQCDLLEFWACKEANERLRSIQQTSMLISKIIEERRKPCASETQMLLSQP